MKTNKQRITQITGIGLLSAIVLVLQLLGSFIHLGMFSISLVLLPIVIGAALYGPFAGAWLGLVFGGAVFLSGDASAFLSISIPGTIITVLLKGLLAGLAAGYVYKLLVNKNKTVATICAAVVCPVVYTGVFLLGCATFFLNAIRTWVPSDFGGNVVMYMIVALVGFNFIAELVLNLILCPTVVHIVDIGKKYFAKR